MELDLSLVLKQLVLVMFQIVLMDMTSARVSNLSMVVAIKITPIVVAIITIVIVIMIEVLV